ncbi:MAG: hypothetical protein Fur0015_04390 [Ignavibacteriales bacterium]
MSNDIKLKIVIDSKEAIASLELTDENIRELYKSFKYGKQEINGFTTAVSQGFNNAREIIQGAKEAFDVLRNTLASPMKAGAGLEVLRASFQGSKTDLENFRQAVAGTVSEANLIKLSNQATDLGLSLKQQTLLFSLAEDAADKYGGSAEENFNKIVAASEGSVKGLKSIGIQKEQYETIVNELALAQGKTIEQLDAESQKQIRLQAIIEASGVTLDDVKSKQADVADQLEQTGVAWEELQSKIGISLNSALAPAIKALMDIYNGLNNIAPGLTTAIGLVATLGVAFGTLKVTGILTIATSITTTLIPALTSAKIAAIGLNASLGLIAIATLGLLKLNSDLKAAREMDDQSKALVSKAKSFLGSYEAAEKYAKEIISKFEQSSDSEIRKQINLRELEIKKLDAKKESTKEDLAQIHLYQEEEKLLRTILDQRKNKADIQGGDLFEKRKDELTAAQAHEQKMAEIEGKSEIEITRMKIKHFYELLKLYEQFGKDSTAITYQQVEEEARLRKMDLSNRDISITAGNIPSAKKFDKVSESRTETGDVREYQRLTGVEEIEMWAEKEKAKVGIYRNADALRAEIDKEALRRKNELAESEKEIERQKEDAKIQSAIGALNYIGGATAKHTLLGKAASAAQAGINTYEAATKALTAGPIIGPILAGIITAMGLVNVGKIMSTQTPKFTGYAEGGRLVSGQVGFVEGYRDEIIAPEKTFEDIMRYELIPKVVNNNVAADNSKLESMLDKYLSRVEEWQSKMEFRINRTDLYSSWEAENNFRNRHK